jgi:hypothetical protein
MTKSGLHVKPPELCDVCSSSPDSNRTPVRPEDFRHAIEHVFAINASPAAYYTGIIGVGREAVVTLAELIGFGLPGGYPAPHRHCLRRPRGGSISCWA